MRDYWSNKKSICLYNKHKGVLCHNRRVAADHEDRTNPNCARKRNGFDMRGSLSGI